MLIYIVRFEATGLTWRSDSPMYMLISSGPLTDRKLSAHSVATAFASSVLPVPGMHVVLRPERGACERSGADSKTEIAH